MCVCVCEQSFMALIKVESEQDLRCRDNEPHLNY